MKQDTFSTHLAVSLVGGLVAGSAVYWFIRGDYVDHSLLRNGLVVGQFVLGLALMVHGWRKHAADASTPAR